MSTLTVLLVCVTVLLLWWRAEPLVQTLVRVHEARYRPVVDPETIAVPKDLLATAASYQEEWAQADVLRSLREDFVRLGSWDLVRMRYHQTPPG